jgi:hypothetical protein
MKDVSKKALLFIVLGLGRTKTVDTWEFSILFLLAYIHCTGGFIVTVPSRLIWYID